MVWATELGTPNAWLMIDFVCAVGLGKHGILEISQVFRIRFFLVKSAVVASDIPIVAV